jgi:hypothetical protein
VAGNKVQIDGVMMRDSAARWYFNGSVEKRVDTGTLHLNVTKVNGSDFFAGGFISTNPTC